MEVKINDVSSVEKKLSISVPEETVQAELSKAFRSLKTRARIPGFRPGKVPMSILEKRFGPSVEAEVLQDLVKNTVWQAVTDHELTALNVREVTNPKREKGKGFSYEASIEIKPDIQPQKYTGLKIKSAEKKITDKEVKASLDHIRESQAVLKNKDDATLAKKGDFVSLEIKPAGAKPDEATQPKVELYEVGNEKGQTELDKALETLKLGESASVTLKNNANEAESVTVQVTLKAIKEKNLPKLDDAFAKTLGAEFKTLDDLKKRLQADLEKEAVTQARDAHVNALMETICKNNPMDLPQSLVEEESQHMLHNLMQRFQSQGIKELPAEFDQNKIKADFKPQAEKRVHEQFMIDAISRAEKIEVSEQELDEKLKDMAKSSNVPVGELRSYYEKNNHLSSVRFQLLTEKTLDFLLSKATIA